MNATVNITYNISKIMFIENDVQGNAKEINRTTDTKIIDKYISFRWQHFHWPQKLFFFMQAAKWKYSELAYCVEYVKGITGKVNHHCFGILINRAFMIFQQMIQHMKVIQEIETSLHDIMHLHGVWIPIIP